MDKLKMQTNDLSNENFKKLQELFPEAVTETVVDGEVVRAIDKDILQQLISTSVVEGQQERYQFTWPDKRNAVRLASEPINKTLRPCRKKSVDFDNTENLYIEGDNLDVLKLLQETYLGKIKMIYIDPPYNTGNDFVYNDSFDMSAEEYSEISGEFDEENNRLVQNTESNGRFHTDWLNMIYPRLKVAKNLLSDDGVIFISIDDHEVDNLKKICDEIFGLVNCLGIITWAKKRKGSYLSKNMVSLTEYCLVYAKRKEGVTLFGGKADATESQPLIKRTNSLGVLHFKGNSVKTKLADGQYKAGVFGEKDNPVILKDNIAVKNGVIVNDFSLEAHFIWSQQFLDAEIDKGGRIVINTLNLQPRAYRIYENDAHKGFGSLINGVTINGTNEDAYEELDLIFGTKNLFNYSKPKNYIKELLLAATHFQQDCLILDFFSGSATTAHAVMQLNAEDGGNRKYIMVQLPELTDEKSEAYKAGYKNICEIGKERIRRAGKKIKEENGEKAKDLDIGFRVLKLDSSNMKDVYYNPSELNFSMLDDMVDNIKDDRTPEDLLFQVMLELGVLPSSKIVETEISGKKVFDVADGFLIACFDKGITDNDITEIAKKKPTYFVMRDGSMTNDCLATNFEQIFETYSSNTVRKVL